MPNFSHEELEEIFGIKFVDRGQGPLDDATRKFKDMVAAELEAAKASTGLSEETQKLDTSLKKIVGDDESSGLKGIAANALKAEKALGAIVSGKGLGKAAGALEGILGAAGLPAGLGLGFVAIEILERKLMPMLEKQLEYLTSESKARTEEVKQLHDLFEGLKKEGERAAVNPASALTKVTTAKLLQDRGYGAEIEKTLVPIFERETFDSLLAEFEENLKGFWGSRKATAKERADLHAKAIEMAREQSKIVLGQLIEGEGDFEQTRRFHEAQNEIVRRLGDRGREILRKIDERINSALLDRESKIAKEDFIGPPAPPHKTPEQIRAESKKQELRELRSMVDAENAANIRAGGQAATEQFLEGVVKKTENLIGEGMERQKALQRAIMEQQEQWERRADALIKEDERSAVRQGMQRAGVWGTPEFRHRVEEDALKALPFTAGDIMRAVNIGYREAIHQLRHEAHRMHKVLGNTFQQQGSPW